MTLLKQAENLLLKFAENMEIGKLSVYSLVKNMSLKLDYQKGHAAGGSRRALASDPSQGIKLVSISQLVHFSNTIQCGNPADKQRIRARD